MRNIVFIAGIIIIALIAVVLLVFSFEMFEQAAASNSTEIDHGSIGIKESDSNIAGTYSWNTYHGANNVTVIEHFYIPNELNFYLYMYIQEVGKNKLKLSAKEVDKMHYSNGSATGSYDIQYISSNLTAVQYYWKYVNPTLSRQQASRGSSVSRGSINGSGSGSGSVGPSSGVNVGRS